MSEGQILKDVAFKFMGSNILYKVHCLHLQYELLSASAGKLQNFITICQRKKLSVHRCAYCIHNIILWRLQRQCSCMLYRVYRVYSALYTGLASCWRFVRPLNFLQRQPGAGSLGRAETGGSKPGDTGPVMPRNMKIHHHHPASHSQGCIGFKFQTN